jgi:hypothetical protein
MSMHLRLEHERNYVLSLTMYTNARLARVVHLVALDRWHIYHQQRAAIVPVKTYPSMNGPNPIPRSDTNVVLTPASFIAAICAGLGAPTPAGGPDILMIVLQSEKAMKSSRYDWIGRRFLKDK